MQPLATRLRPQSLTDYVGQEHLVAPGKPLHQAIQKKHLFSFIFWGPPGVGKTTLARIYANEFNALFQELSAVSAGKNDIRKFLKAELEQADQPRVLFLDEAHRFNKAQQDFLLPYVERGEIILLGATTENPSFSIISALLSRLRVFVLHELDQAQMTAIIKRLQKEIKLKINQDSQDWLQRFAAGDARQLINIVEATQQLYGKITPETLKEALQSKHLRYDKLGEEHYNTISAFIKSMRASDADAAIYYLARMVEAGEDPLFIARRMVIFASEDIGVAQPTALVVANEVFNACRVIGYPECAINLAHGVVYLAQAEKDRRAYNALRAAQKDVQTYGNLPIPLELRNAPTKLMKNLGYGKGYEKYPKNKSLLPEKLRKKKYFKKINIHP